ncbi:hypothetical protein N7489_008346 [Penicillium chrysogenum]|jgi:hypothetical protein|uniref:uncharacterized protein n=1 Tax=Penicillium chrysogenum TaxID=5076 RepID=UPI00239411A0|nr:uncharacterized protein N7489_008346 [Penicillium chrysogenum]KAJ5238255.1 hypothetical protein N7489_008346 [Penicillium chrysogenum]KAJ5278561.1 hypothetical protein N7524_004714 [Penicillium chrysogenum]KAJ6159399.1 hypothetical protein N7497_003936 [Penicillium chrysogenum]
MGLDMGFPSMRKRALASPVKLPLAQPGTRERARRAFTGQPRVIIQVVAGYGLWYGCFKGSFSHRKGVQRADEEIGVLVAEGFGVGRGGRGPGVGFCYRQLKAETSARWEVGETGIMDFFVDI